MPDAIFKKSPQSKKPRAVPSEIYDERFYAIKPEGSNDGVFYYDSSILVTIRCNMFFDDFPFDSQDCPVILTSLRNPGHLLWQVSHFNWLENNFENGEYHCSVDNVTVGPQSEAGKLDLFAYPYYYRRTHLHRCF